MRFSKSLAVFAGCCLAVWASAQVVLKPTGSGAMPLRTKALKARTDVRGGFATTQLELTFANATQDRVEADFIYVTKPGTLVTDFAYYYGDERVPARVVEKERAAAIYQHITSRMRDPALIELIGKNTFRARIFPVMPNADLRVEMKLVQVLQNGVYELPIQTEKGNPLGSLDVQVDVRKDPGIIAVHSNLGKQSTPDPKTLRVSLTAQNFRPQQDMRVAIQREPVALQTSMYAARSGGRDGYFALSLTAKKAMSAPVVRVEGCRPTTCSRRSYRA
jgi:Ca-activated chloride channel homolog